MKKNILFLLAASMLATTFSCGDKKPLAETVIDDPVTQSSPTPTKQIPRVTLSEEQSRCVEAGNAMAFRFLEKMYRGGNLVVSPLSLQYAMAMTANGAGGETLREIVGFLGYGDEGLEALNAYCKTMLEQLPAVDLEVDLRLTDALLVNDKFPLLGSFQKSVQENYYAAVENMDFGQPSLVAARINDWAKRSTNGFIDKVLEPSEISADAVAYLMNALYFKAAWAGSKYNPMFREYATHDEAFTLSNGSVRQLPMMRTANFYGYAEMDGYRVLALPYAGGKFFMYILLPDQNDLEGLVKKLPDVSWNHIVSSLKHDAEINVKLPKFDIENKFSLTDALQQLGVEKAFVRGEADFQAMFQPQKTHYDYWISKVIQKARISVAEWGTEAAAVTVVEMVGATSVGPGRIPKRIDFFADHPFVFLIGEDSSGAILFEGTYTGK